MLLKASETGEVALIHHQAAKALDIAPCKPPALAGVTAPLLGDGSGGHR
jgi:hypothetical protein